MDVIAGFIQKHQLPNEFRTVAEQYYSGLCVWLEKAIANKKQYSETPMVLGINGAQGTGKSTLADFVAAMLTELEVAVVSIDDFYLTKSDRLALAKTAHPLLKTRGVPGTHDISLAMDTLNQLLAGKAQVALPRFDKSIDDRAHQQAWTVTDKPVDLIILEGWCVGSMPEQADALLEAVNPLEAEQDADAVWRTYVNNCLASDYPQLFDLIDALVLLKAPDFDAVYRWRLEQEMKLAAKIDAELNKKLDEGSNSELNAKPKAVMDPEQVAEFIQHYERLTRHNLTVLPDRADVVFELDHDHQIVSEQY